jgi:hypothetical protein
MARVRFPADILDMRLPPCTPSADLLMALVVVSKTLSATCATRWLAVQGALRLRRGLRGAVDMREQRLKQNISATEDEPDPQFQPWMMNEHFDRSKEEAIKSVALLNELGENAEEEAVRWRTAQALLQQQRSGAAKQKMTALEREALMSLADALTLPQPSSPPPERLAPGKKMKVSHLDRVGTHCTWPWCGVRNLEAPQPLRRVSRSDPSVWRHR